MGSAPKAVGRSFNGWNAEYLDAQRDRWLEDPSSVPDDVRWFFEGFELGLNRSAPSGPASGTPGAAGISAAPIAASPTPPGPLDDRRADRVAPLGMRSEGGKFAAVVELVRQYRTVGHMCAALDPFGRERPMPASLDPTTHGLTDADLDETFDLGAAIPTGPATLRDIIGLLDDTYCRSIGVEFMHIEDDEERAWLARQMEQSRNRPALDAEGRKRLLEELVEAESFERFLHTRYPGEKRFSLEGSESLIPLLHAIIERAGDHEAQEIVMGMAHRGRLNVLRNILGKTDEQIFTEFEDTWQEDFAEGGGDVKYHRGYSGEYQCASGAKIWLAMASNPSHLEAVDTVVLGRCRAKQRARGDTNRDKVIPVVMHGDAAVIAQGMVAEMLNLSQLAGYCVGGCIHVVVNNMIGFTTSPEHGRSSRYCTDMAKMISAPAFHVNAEDPEACVQAARLALEYRQRFKKEVFIDMWCYRRWGHNEGDEPSFTQPLMYDIIRKKPSVMKTYAERLLAEKIITEEEMTRVREELDAAYDKAQSASKTQPYDPTIDPGSRKWQGFGKAYSHAPVQTGVAIETLQEVAGALGRVPEGFKVHRKLQRLLKTRKEIADSLDNELDYATAESLAFGTLLLEGTPVRLTGQDVRRGTFSHRHALLRDTETAAEYIPLNHIHEVGDPATDHPVGDPGADGEPRQGRFCVYDSPLSEEACVGFEYGYALVDPNQLVLWEAQFGDFVNGAQVQIDQFLASAEIKWQRWNGLVMLLPHGYEGQGPEHSSGRLERFLQLCGDDNMQVVYPSTAAQIFHLLRRQVRRPFRKPLIVMTPKSMLRVNTSTVRDLVEGRFLEIIDDPAFASDEKRRKKVSRVALCTGKIYHELAQRRDEARRDDVAIVRVEQLYPLHHEMLRGVLDRYPASVEVVWAQEEPRNMGAYRFMEAMLREKIGVPVVNYIGRSDSATPAVGSKTKHKEQQEAILTATIGPAPDTDSPVAPGDVEGVTSEADEPGEGGAPAASAPAASGKSR